MGCLGSKESVLATATGDDKQDKQEGDDQSKKEDSSKVKPEDFLISEDPTTKANDVKLMFHADISPINDEPVPTTSVEPFEPVNTNTILNTNAFEEVKQSFPEGSENTAEIKEDGDNNAETTTSAENMLTARKNDDSDISVIPPPVQKGSDYTYNGGGVTEILKSETRSDRKSRANSTRQSTVGRANSTQQGRTGVRKSNIGAVKAVAGVTTEASENMVVPGNAEIVESIRKSRNSKNFKFVQDGVAGSHPSLQRISRKSQRQSPVKTSISLIEHPKNTNRLVGTQE